MIITIENIVTDTDALSPMLTILVTIKYYFQVEAPLLITGSLKSVDGKKLCSLNEVDIVGNSSMQLKVLNDDARTEIFQRSPNIYSARFSAALSHEAIEHIECLREKNPQKSVDFYFDFIIKSVVTINEENTFKVDVEKHNAQFHITQSDWIHKYAQHLKIGNFLLLELEIPNKNKVIAEWCDLYDRLYYRLQEMETNIKCGNWKECMIVGRQFYENLNLMETKPPHKVYLDSLKELFINDQHSEQGFDDFRKGIRHFFDFISKYIHDHSKIGILQSVPVATKEDAYFVYVVAIGLLNIIGKKLRK